MIDEDHPLSDGVAVALVRMLHALLSGEGRGGAHAIADELVQSHRSFKFEPYRGQSSAYVVDTMQTVLHHYFSTDNFTDCVIATVNQGGYADTTGALGAMLAGATDGLAAIPKRWLERLDRAAGTEIRQQVPRLLALSACHGAQDTAD